MVPFATVLADDDASGTSGFAAVMGSKNLKAIAVQGSGKITVSNRERLRELTKYLRGLVKGGGVTPPTLGVPPFPAKKRKQACFGCIAGCLRMTFEADNGDRGKFMCQQSGMYIEPAMEYYKEWTEVPFQASRLCDRYGLDTMVLQPLINWLHRCEQEGILTDDETGIPISKYGSLEFIESIIKKISLRQGFGDILAQGIVKAADFIGKGSDRLIGDLVLPKTGEEWVYDPRMFITAGLFYATEPKRPIQHLHEISWLIAQWVAWMNGAERAYVSGDVVRGVAKRFWGSEIAADFSTYEGKALAAKKIQDRQYLKESLILCDYAWPIAHSWSSEGHMGDPSVESKIYFAVVGKDMDEEGLYEIGERIFNIQRAILVREGHRGKESDSLPEFNYSIPLKFTPHNPECLVPGISGEPISRKGAVVDRSEFDKMRSEYYSLRDWDIKSGLQTVSKLDHLGLRDVGEYLAKKKLAISSG
jgi:aldehyde:ferredoxin oxidoreductase